MSNKSILIVDDSIDNLDLSRMLLELEGYSVRTAENAEEAMRVLAAFHPSLILMDIQLPHISGYEATKKIKSLKKDLPIIAQTAHFLNDEKKKAFKAGCDGYISKPIDSEELFSIFNKFLTDN